MAKKQKKQLPAKSTRNPTDPNRRTYTIPDHRLEKPEFDVRQVRKGDKVSYEVTGDMSAPVPPIRESKYLNKKQCIEIYRWMVLNRRMESGARESLQTGQSGRRRLLRTWPGSLLLRFGIRVAQRRLVRAHDSQSGLDCWSAASRRATS